MPRKIPLLVLILAITAVIVYIGFTKLQTSPANTPTTPLPIPVKTTQAQQAHMPVFIRSIGTVISPHQIQIRPQVDGTITQLHIQDGQLVQQGTLLVSIDDREIKALLQQQRAELANRQAQLEIAQLDLKRYQELRSHNAIAAQTLDQQQALVNQLRQAIAAQQASLKALEVKLSHTQIYAPIDGVIGIVNIHQGNYVRAGESALFSIVQINPIQIETALNQNTLAQLLSITQTNALQQIPVLAYTTDEKTPIAQGHLIHMDNQVMSQTGTIRLRAQFENNPAQLWPGQTVKTLILLQTLQNATVIPQAAIQQGNQNTYVWRVENNHVHPVTIEIIQTNENLAAVTGIHAGEEIIIDGASRITQGSQIQRITQTPLTNPDLIDQHQ